MRINQRKDLKQWRGKLYEIVFQNNSLEGKLFDVILLILIFISTVAIIMESVQSINLKIGNWLYLLDWWVTISFTSEFILRCLSLKKPSHYIFSFYGIVDLLSILPTYLSLIFIQSHYLSVLRFVRLLRIFRILQLPNYTNESHLMLEAVKQSRIKIFIFIFFIIIVALILGSIMYVIESGYHEGFSSIPQSMYWAIVTLTTVGYGDIAPVTFVGKLIASCIMILGYSIIAVPTGLVTSEYNKARDRKSNLHCYKCKIAIKKDDNYCSRCGEEIKK